jgi:hypothetical protein
MTTPHLWPPPHTFLTSPKTKKTSRTRPPRRAAAIHGTYDVKQDAPMLGGPSLGLGGGAGGRPAPHAWEQGTPCATHGACPGPDLGAKSSTDVPLTSRLKGGASSCVCTRPLVWTFHSYNRYNVAGSPPAGELEQSSSCTLPHFIRVQRTSRYVASTRVQPPKGCFLVALHGVAHARMRACMPGTNGQFCK